MRVLLLLSASLIVLLCVHAQKPHHCRAPPYLQGKLHVVNPEGKTTVFEEFYYDAIEQRVRAVAYGKHGSETVFLDRLFLYRERAYYDIHHHNKTCVKTHFTSEFRPLEIPFDAHFNFQFVLGSLSAPAEGLLVNNWEGSVPEHQTNYSMTVTEFGCIPITILSHVEGTGYVISSFYDIVTGIENPEVLVRPSFCNSATVVEREDAAAAHFFTSFL